MHEIVGLRYQTAELETGCTAVQKDSAGDGIIYRKMW